MPRYTKPVHTVVNTIRLKGMSIDMDNVTMDRLQDERNRSTERQRFVIDTSVLVHALRHNLR